MSTRNRKLYVLEFECDEFDLNNIFSDDARSENEQLNDDLNDIGSYLYVNDITNGVFCTLVFVHGLETVRGLIKYARDRWERRERDPMYGNDFGVTVYEMKELPQQTWD